MVILSAPNASPPGVRAGVWTDARTFALVLAALLVVRIAALMVSPLNLHFDEAQYWLWSRTLDWGYFSKPPLIAWVIAATTALFGNGEWAVRLGAALAHAAGAAAVYALAARAYGSRAALWAGLLWLTLPALWLSSFVISTDALMLPLWAAALYCFWRLKEAPSPGWGALLGLCVGAGALAKYAMLYFILCAALAALWSPAARRALLSWPGAIAGAAALLVLAPNLAWNAAHDFETVAHTASNANLGGRLFRPDELLKFLGGQAAVIGPVLFVALIWFLAKAARAPARLDETARTLLAFTLPPLVIIMAQALVSRANANWAAAAYPAASVLLAGWLAATTNGRRALWAALATQAALGAIVLAALALPTFADALGQGRAIKRMRGWDAMAAETAARASEAPYTAVLADHRAGYFELRYYWRDRSDLPPVRAWRLHAAPENHAEATDPMRPEDSARVLVVHMVKDYAPLVIDDFARVTPLGQSPLRVGSVEGALFYSRGEGYAEKPRDAAYEARLERIRDEANAQ
ncbi:MAG: glycosyltransferase family 39 protein [Hyphomonadaceae bacterium]|nr:glycosyltransferase family 39 protein [Hyphomonadaceae bacterium]